MQVANIWHIWLFITKFHINKQLQKKQQSILNEKLKALSDFSGNILLAL
ncbi:hypothetical protein RCA_03645 [Rickettsia canadensis str. CA410]|uniref:Uncharacterized protein n=1 Tax=Rickettsia canadensis str. CA410 TaxID=1105107 RepID=A0ABM5MSK2_RICCA|nr:hypothetical protein RCA_03645 [Rickettsia canadensis str. CA410]